MSVNELMILGNAGQDPEFIQFESGNCVAEFSVALSEKWKCKKTGDMQERTEWVDVKAWGKQAEYIKNWLSKGDSVYASGRIRTDSFERKDGSKGFKTFLDCKKVEIFSKNRRDNSSGGADSSGLAEALVSNDADEPSF